MMYQTVYQHDYSEVDSEMDDRDSIYLDTISLASEYPNRKSMSLSRQTIYHSAEDVQNGRSTPDSNRTNKKYDQIDGGATSDRMAFGKYGQSDEVSARLLILNNKKTVTYSQWKSRTWSRFQDGERSVDFVLAYAADDPHPRNADKRQGFENNLINEGLQLEREETQKIHFVKIHAPTEVLGRYCEILKIKMPIRKLQEQDDIIEPEFQLMESMMSFFCKPFDFVKLDPTLFPQMEYKLTHTYSRNHSYLFDVDSPNFFNQSIRIAVVQFILERQRFSEDDETHNNIGIDKLLADGVYEASYPLHDGDCNIPGSERSLLFHEWAAVSKWIKHQPLDNIKEYFGVKIALYFAWLGFYTHMLIPASIVGIFCFLYGFISFFSNSVSKDICSPLNNIIMCPQCDEKCDYWYLKDTCIYSRLSNLFDNDMTVIFACFMSFWAVLYLELWKRYSAKLIHRWGLADFSHQAEHPRPQYLSRLRKVEKKRFNVVHRVLEPHVPFWKLKFPVYVMSFSVIFLMICLAIGAVFGVTIYRMSLMYSRRFFESQNLAYHTFVLPATAAVLNLIIITALNYLYDYVAVYLTNIEFRRTQQEYDESLSLKTYLFQFVNYYSSIFYIAFMKGKFVGYPAKYNRIFKLRQEECSPGGCLMELCIQLVIIMVGKQVVNGFLEMFIPFVTNTYNSLRNKLYQTRDGGVHLISCNQWTNDFKLLAWSPRGLFDDYLEMIIQYGFVTLFVVAFPLAPLFALINNIFEMRLDAKKFLKYFRRPVPARVKDIGIWINIMAILGRIAVVSSAFIIAFSSNFIPRLVYMMRLNPDHTDEGFLNFTLAYFNPKDFQNGTAPLQSTFHNVTVCRYQEYRNPPWDKAPYKRPLVYWHILAARLAFFVVFQSYACGITLLLMLSWAISCTLASFNEAEFQKLTAQKSSLHRKSLNINSGDIVRIVAPASATNEISLPLIRDYVESLGLVANMTANIYNQSEPFYSNWDEFRANDLISALLDDSAKIIWCIRGGTGSIRLIPYLEQRLPATLSHKIFIGYSDITVLHLYFQKKYGWQTIHGAMLDAIAREVYDQSGESVVLLTDLIFERKESICLPSLTKLDENDPVTVLESAVVGGNVVLVESSIGTLWEVNAEGKILFLEDVGEAAYRLERSLDHMKQSGIFNLVEAVIFGDFTDADDDALIDLVLKRFAQSVTFPVFRVTGIGHGSINYPLPLATFTRISRTDSINYSFCVNNIQSDSNASCTVFLGRLLLIISFGILFLLQKKK